MRNKSVVWIPVLLVGAMVYWTLALGFGGLSLVSLTADLPLSDGDARDSYQSITVNLTEAPEPQGTMPAPGQGEDPSAEESGVTVDLVPAGDIPRPNPSADQGGLGLSGGSLRTGPGNTAF
jgi:hypothetical protein